MVGSQGDVFFPRQGFGDFAGPIVQVLEVAVLVQGDSACANDKLFHSQVLTLSYCTDSATNPG